MARKSLVDTYRVYELLDPLLLHLEAQAVQLLPLSVWVVTTIKKPVSRATTLDRLLDAITL